MSKTLIFTATYDEAGNIADLIRDIHQQAPTADILVVDDHSPDGTGDILNRLKDEFSFLKVHHRPGKQGLGTAHLFAFQYAMENQYEELLTLDADFSHNPKYIPQLLEKLKQYEFVIGSRYTKGGGQDYGFFRFHLSKTANLLARFMLKLPFLECTTSYRGIRIETLKRVPLNLIQSDGYSFFVEFLFYLSMVCTSVTEIPIQMENRRAGQTKISEQEIYKAILTLFRLSRINQSEGIEKPQET